MGLFRRIGNSIARFMYGRNGMDQLNQLLLRGYLVIFLVQMVAAMVRIRWLATVCELLLWPLIVVLFFRMFSKNLYKRREENQKWMSWWWSVKSRGDGARARHADKEHKYFICKQCRTICRVPVGKGKIVITCPKCGAKIEART